MEENKKGIVYNIVDSVKGGCGKSTFSIFLALTLDADRYNELMKEEKEVDMFPPEVCLIDMDLQGTALAYLLFGEKIKDLKSGTGAEIYLNEKVTKYNSKEKKYIANFEWTLEGRDYKFDVILSSPRQVDKNRFRTMGGLVSSPEVPYSTFRAGFRNMLKQEDLQSQNFYQYRHIIFDMPPNSDGYSDVVFDSLLNSKYSIMKKEDRCNLFLIQTLDMGHRYATKEHLREIIESEEGPKVDRIFIVFDNINMDTDDVKLLVDQAVNEYVHELEQWDSMTEEWKKKVFFVGLRFFPEYFSRCCMQDGIKNKPIKSDIIHPILYFADFNLNESTIATDSLLKIMNGEKLEMG